MSLHYVLRVCVCVLCARQVEDGAWVNADGDFGAPQCINWNWPLQPQHPNATVPVRARRCVV